MGIKGLGKFIGDFAPRAIKQQAMGSFMSRVIAIDASMSLYQFMIAIREDETGSFGTFTNDAGECTSHIAGMLNRALKLLEQGIKPVYVFDGKPPQLKSGELAKRREIRDAAHAAAEQAREEGNVEELKKQVGRAVRVSRQHNEEVQRLLRLMGLPVVQAPCEAEAQCAELTKKKKVWATATEDADALTFGATRLIRNLTFTEKKSSQAGGCSNRANSHHSAAGGQQQQAGGILVIDLPTLLEELQFTQEQFIDFCILCGCDYCGTVRGVGAKTAYGLIREHKTLEGALKVLGEDKIPERFPYQEAREFFIHPEVTPAEDITFTWGDVDVEGLRTFLVKENQFNEQRVENYILRLKKGRGKASQTRLENFFGATTTKSSSLMQKQQEQKQLELEKKKNRGIRGIASASGGGASAKKGASKSGKKGAGTAAGSARTPKGPATKKEEQETRETMKRRASEDAVVDGRKNEKRLKSEKEEKRIGQDEPTQEEEEVSKTEKKGEGVEGETEEDASVKKERQTILPDREGGDESSSIKEEKARETSESPTLSAPSEEKPKATEKSEGDSTGSEVKDVNKNLDEAQSSSLFDDDEGEENWPPNDVVVGGSTSQ